MPYKRTGRPPGRPSKAERARRAAAGETPTGNPDGKPRPLPTFSKTKIDRLREGLSPRQEAVACALIAGASRSAAARAGGFSPTSGSLSPRTVTGRKIYSAVLRALDRAGATRAHAAKRIREALDAEETKFFPQLAYPDPNEGVVIPRENVVAHGHRFEAACEVLRRHEAYPGEDDAEGKQSPPLTQINVEIHVAPPHPGLPDTHQTITVEAPKPEKNPP